MAEKALMDALDRLHCGGLVFDKQGRVIEFNGTAQQVLRRELDSERSEVNADWVAAAVRRLGLRALANSGSDKSNCLMTDRRALAVHSIPLDYFEGGSGRWVLVMVDLSVEPNVTVLQKLFSLTPAEASLAVSIGQGKTPAAIARSNGVTIATVRSQLAAVFAKTNTQRQAELVGLLARVSLLPAP